MAYLMLKYQDPTTYALVDLSTDEFSLVQTALRELHGFYGRWGDSEEAQRQQDRVQDLIDVLERRYEDDDR